MVELPPYLEQWMSGPAAAAGARLLKVAFLVFAGLWVMRAWWFSSVGDRMKPGGGRTGFTPAGWLSLLLAVLFIALLVHQTTWQMGGFARPKFMQFVRRYDQRPVSGADQVQRGRIRAVDGAVLAESDPDRPGHRRYPGGAATAHVTGYLDARYGTTGLEAADDDYLSGRTYASPGEIRRFRQNILRQDGMRGNDLTLTLDLTLQRRAAELMAGRRGAVVMLRPSDGALLVLHSSPGFAPERVAEELAAERSDRPMFHRALEGLYPPGSTFKIVVAGLALEKGRTPVLDCPGTGFTPVRGVRPIRDHEYYEAEEQARGWGGHGRIGLDRAFEVSSNVYFAQLAAQLGAPELAAAAEQTGLERAYVVFEGSSGRMVSKPAQFPELEARDVLEATQCAIGQGRLLVTPLHMAVIAGAVAADGIAWTPRLSARMAPKPMGVYFRRPTAVRLRGMMRNAVVRGTGTPANLPGFEIAGKTGTAEAPGGEPHAWFVGFAPASKPAVAFAVVVENAGSGSKAAAPIAAQLVDLAKRRGWFAGGPPSTVADDEEKGL